MITHILIAGRPGIGKTTFIKMIIAEIKKLRPSWTLNGFYTNEIRENKRRIGFAIYTLDGQEGILASLKESQFTSKLRVGKYSVYITDLEKMVVPLLYKGADLLLIDELGKMELLSKKFREAIKYAFDNTPRIVATIPYYENSFLSTIKNRPNIKIKNLTRENRAELYVHVVQSILGNH
ncbi:MAG: NTPase [Promethearchaeota archaeon]